MALPQRTKGIGERLKIARLSRGLSIDDISSVLCIQSKYLRALESNQLLSIQEVFYREQYSKSYAQYLGFDWEVLKNDSRYQEQEGYNDQQHYSLLTSSPRNFFQNFEPRIFIRNGSIALILILCFSYFVSASSYTFSPPELSLDTPLDQLTTTQEKLTVSGKTQKESSVVMINGARVPKNSSGYFKQEIILTSGLNTIHVTAQKRFSPSRTVTRQVFRQTDEKSLTLK